jgi:hypothetical protein
MMANKQERDLILDMLAAGKISVREARELFDTVERIEERERNTHDTAQPLPLGAYIDQVVQDARDDIARIVDPEEFPFGISL